MELAILVLCAFVVIEFAWIWIDIVNIKRKVDGLRLETLNLVREDVHISDSALKHCANVLNQCEVLIGNINGIDSLLKTQLEMDKEIMDRLTETTEKQVRMDFDISSVAASLSRFEERLNDFDALKYVSPEDPEEQASYRLDNFINKFEEGGGKE